MKCLREGRFAGGGPNQPAGRFMDTRIIDLPLAARRVNCVSWEENKMAPRKWKTAQQRPMIRRGSPVPPARDPYAPAVAVDRLSPSEEQIEQILEAVIPASRHLGTGTFLWRLREELARCNLAVTYKTRQAALEARQRS